MPSPNPSEPSTSAAGPSTPPLQPSSSAPQPARPKFQPHPIPPSPEHSILHSPPQTYIPLLSAPATFPCSSFSATLTSLLEHPEHTGPLILRAEPLPPPVPPIPSATPQFEGWRPTQVTRRRLLPRVLERDRPLDQTCVRYRPSNPGEEGEMLLLIPELGEGERPPYYHPDVDRLALIYTSYPEPRPAEDESEGDIFGSIRIEVLLPPSTPTSEVNESSRLYRTALHLLETTHKHALGHLNNYRKRVKHDILVPRAPYQDLYLRLKGRHKSHVGKWSLGTDPRKHVFEVKKAELDVAIAAFLMLLWKADYPPLERPSPPRLEQDDKVGKEHEEEEYEWSTWGRPPGGFVDLGCGNGLLVHILLSEGYTGYGIDLTPRKTWSSFPAYTQLHLHQSALDPLASPPVSPPLPEGAFLIGNHPDELTPYVPLLATLHHASGWLIIPCCAYTFTGRFTTQTYKSKLPGSEVERRMDEGGEGQGRVRAYLVWLEEVGRRMGWRVGLEALRMPSTRNWGLVGRREEPREREAKLANGMDDLSLNERDGSPLTDEGVEGAIDDVPSTQRSGRHSPGDSELVRISQEEGMRWADEKLEEIRRTGGFKIREGKGHGHGHGHVH